MGKDTIAISVSKEDLDATGRVILEAGRWCKIFYADEGSAIIRCKECKRQDTDNVFLSMWCYEMRTFVKPNEFCSRAERRSDG